MSAPIEALRQQYKGQLTSGTLISKTILTRKSLSGQEEMAASLGSFHPGQGRLVYPAGDIQQVRSSFDVPVGLIFDVPVDPSFNDPVDPLKMAEFFPFTPSELQQERVLKSLLKKVDSVTDEAEFELLMDKALFIGVDKIIDGIISELKTEDIDCSVVLEVFHDMEVENWDSFKITIKSKDSTVPHERLLMLWDKLSLSVVEETNKLKSQGELTESEQAHIQSKLIISIEVD